MALIDMVVPTTQGDREVLRAESRGLFAIHRTIDAPDYWTITHRPTGYAVFKQYDTRAEAREALANFKAVSERNGVDLTELSNEWLNEQARVLRDTLGFARLPKRRREWHGGV